ncbi:MAG: hypothetical protein ACYTFI_15745 [Planctomycetota bacterium]|jgi:hypothetical protein
MEKMTYWKKSKEGLIHAALLLALSLAMVCSNRAWGFPTYLDVGIVTVSTVLLLHCSRSAFDQGYDLGVSEHGNSAPNPSNGADAATPSESDANEAE